MSKEPCKVLVVDEDRSNADTTVVLLQMWGHEAVPAYSAEDATAKAGALDPDVVLVDLERSVVKGIDLSNELRRRCPEAKLIAISAFTESDIVRRGREVPFEKVIPKPAPAQKLKEAVETECAATSPKVAATH
jgi:CheY-like chemotaxis protein